MEQIDWLALRRYVVEQFRLPIGRSAHAPDHWERVERYGLLLAAESGADPLVVRLFALLHDSQRRDEVNDPEHGPRAAAFAAQLNETHLHLPPEQLKLLQLACRDHERGYTVLEPTVGTCWDSDRLDLDRVGYAIDEKYMSTAPGRRLGNLHAYKRQQLAGIRA